jgi:hypothetical protein
VLKLYEYVDCNCVYEYLKGIWFAFYIMTGKEELFIVTQPKREDFYTYCHCVCSIMFS